MDNKVTAKMIRKAVKILRKHELKPDEDGFITIEDPTVRTDFLYLRRIERGNSWNIKNYLKNLLILNTNGGQVGRSIYIVDVQG